MSGQLQFKTDLVIILRFQPQTGTQDDWLQLHWQ